MGVIVDVSVSADLLNVTTYKHHRPIPKTESIAGVVGDKNDTCAFVLCKGVKDFCGFTKKVVSVLSCKVA